MEWCGQWGCTQGYHDVDHPTFKTNDGKFLCKDDVENRIDELKRQRESYILHLKNIEEELERAMPFVF